MHSFLFHSNAMNTLIITFLLIFSDGNTSKSTCIGKNSLRKSQAFPRQLCMSFPALSPVSGSSSFLASFWRVFDHSTWLIPNVTANTQTQAEVHRLVNSSLKSPTRSCEGAAHVSLGSQARIGAVDPDQVDASSVSKTCHFYTLAS